MRYFTNTENELIPNNSCWQLVLRKALISPISPQLDVGNDSQIQPILAQLLQN